MPALEAAGADNLADKIILDISSPLDFSNGFPPTLFVKDTDSLGEQVQRAFPQARVVKTLNTLTAELMVHPKNLGQESSVFVSGDDAEAKATVTELLESFGHTDVIDLGDISTARGTEMLLPVWLRLMGAFGTAAFNFKIVR
jgi:predicted dinucleotide-binding enzyme